MTDEQTMVLGWRACHWIRFPIWLSFGKACVTEAAFLWKPQYAASFLVGRLFRGAGVSIPREEVQVAERGTFGLNKNILSIRTKTGKQYVGSAYGGDGMDGSRLLKINTSMGMYRTFVDIRPEVSRLNDKYSS